MSDIQHTRQNNSHFLYDPSKLSDIDNRFFSAEYWQAQNAITGSATGRGTTHFFQYQQQSLVLRHYRRGGLMGKCLQDQYLYLGLANTRAWQEFQLLRQMQTLQLPTPAPIAARVRLNKLHYTCDIITARITDAKDAHHVLCHQPLSHQQWHNIGRAIAQLHNVQVYHHDLNIHNVMLDTQDKAWIIDFDKCKFRHGQRWKKRNLSRLYRSLQKELAQNQHYHWQTSDWQILLDGYQQR